MLIIHGLIGSLDYFDPGRRICGASVRGIDLVGYGTSPLMRGQRPTLQDQADHVASHLPDGPTWLLGHSMGGAIAMMVADQHAHRVVGVINVEGNFTLKDAFWSSTIADQSPEDWAERYDAMRRDVSDWLTRCSIKPNPQRIEWATRMLDNQPPETVYAMSQAIIAETGTPAYLDAVRRVVDRGLAIHLIAGERSAGEWDVPKFVRDAARTDTQISGAGHLMMLEEPDAFCRAVETILASS